jgi:hypothetical protein
MPDGLHAVRAAHFNFAGIKGGAHGLECSAITLLPSLVREEG